MKIGMTSAEEVIKNEKNSRGSGDLSSSLVAATLQLLKASNPRIGDILSELKTIQEGICQLHRLKAEHRKSYFYLGLQHCEKCAMWARAQKHLRHRRTELCYELQWLSYGLDPMRLLELEEEEK